MYRPVPRPLILVFPARALSLNDSARRTSRSETAPLLASAKTEAWGTLLLRRVVRIL
jgi:hypothetical protein